MKKPVMSVGSKTQVNSTIVIGFLITCSIVLLGVFGFSFISNLVVIVSGPPKSTQLAVVPETYKTTTEYIERNGQKYTITIKTNNKTGETTNTITDPTGAIVAELPQPDIKFVDSEVAAAVNNSLAAKKSDDLIKVVVVFDLNAPTVKASSVAKSRLEMPNEKLETGVDENGLPTSIKLNGKVISAQEFDTYQKDREQKNIAKNKALAQDQTERLKNLLQPSISDIASSPNLAKRKNVLATAFARGSNKKQLDLALKGGASSLTLELKPSEIKDLEKFAAETGDKSIMRIEKYSENETEPINLADVSSHVGLDAYSFPLGLTGKGHNVGILEVEANSIDPACPTIAATGNNGRYTLFYNPTTSADPNLHGLKIYKILRETSPFARIYCADRDKINLNGDSLTTPSSPIYIISASLNYKSGSNEYFYWDRNFDNVVYNRDIAIFNAAGNDSGYLISPAKGPNVITVGSYDSNLQIESYSSYYNPETGNAKPEISSIGHISPLGGGTSLSTPVVAGMAADLMSRMALFQYRPALLKAQIMAAATKPVSGGFDKVGVGGAYFYGMRYTFTSWWHDPISSDTDVHINQPLAVSS